MGARSMPMSGCASGWRPHRTERRQGESARHRREHGCCDEKGGSDSPIVRQVARGRGGDDHDVTVEGPKRGVCASLELVGREELPEAHLVRVAHSHREAVEPYSGSETTAEVHGLEASPAATMTSTLAVVMRWQAMMVRPVPSTSPTRVVTAAPKAAPTPPRVPMSPNWNSVRFNVVRA